MVSQKTQLVVANLCYANVLHMFAMFQDPKNRGTHFTWDTFSEQCAGWAYTWLSTGYSSKITPEVLRLAMQYSWEISARATKHAGLYDQAISPPEAIQRKFEAEIRRLKLTSKKASQASAQ